VVAAEAIWGSANIANNRSTAIVAFKTFLLWNNVFFLISYTSFSNDIISTPIRNKTCILQLLLSVPKSNRLESAGNFLSTLSLTYAARANAGRRI
jgi:hypothetical protein